MAPWEKYGDAPAAQPSGPLTGPPPPPTDPYKVRQDNISNSRADANLGLSEESSDRSTKGQIQDYRKEYNTSVPVKTYGIAIQSLANAIKRGEDGSGDVALIYDYAKAMDPESVVREAEVGLALSGGSLIETKAAELKRTLGIDGGGKLPPTVRARLRREIFNAAMSRRQAYEQQREYFGQLAQRGNYDPFDVVGPDIGEPFREELGKFSQDGTRFTPDELAARAGLKTEQPNESLLNPLPGERRGELNTDALGPGQKFAFDENGQPIGIVNADGSWGGGYSQISDEVSERAAEAEMNRRLGEGNTISSQPAFDNGVSFFLSDELYGVRGGLGELLSGGSFSEGYKRERDIERAAVRASTEEHGVVPGLVGSLFAPVGALGRAATPGQFAGQGAALGAMAGFGTGEGLENSLLRAGGGAAIGSGVGYGAAKAGQGINALAQTQAGQRITGRVADALNSRRPRVDREVIDAGARQNVPIRLADAVEGKRPALAALEKTPTGSPRVAQAYADDVAATQRATDAAIPQGGAARDNSTLGKTIQSAMERTNTKAKAQTSALFTRVERMAPDAKGDGAATVAFINKEIARLNAAGRRGNSSNVKALEDIRDDITESGLSVASLQALRASVRQRASDNGLDMNAAQSMFGRVDEAATKELEGVLRAANPRAVGAFRNANKSHADRLAFRREVARELLGTKNNPLDAEKAALRLLTKIGDKGDEAGFGRVWASLEKDEQADLAATIVNRMAGGDEFSLAKLATGLEGANERTLRTVFGKEGQEALRDIRLIARRKTQTARGLNNSNTGSVVEAKGNSLLDTLLGVFGYTQGGPLGAAAAVGARVGGEKIANNWRANLLLKPDFTKWLRQTPNTANPDVINRHFDRLNKIASREQAFLMDAKALQDYLARQFSEGVGRAAATGQQGENNRGE